MESRVGKLGLRFDAGSAQDEELVACETGRLVEEGGFADPRLATNDESATGPRGCRVKDFADQLELADPPHEHACILSPRDPHVQARDPD